MQTLCKDPACTRKDIGLLLIRIALGAVFIAHGYMKLANLVGTQQFFVAIGLPAFLAIVVALIEFVGGIMVLVGVKIRWAAIALAVVMVGAIVMVKMPNGFLGSQGVPGYEFDFVLLLASIGIAFLGSGHFSVSGCRHAMRLNKNTVSNV